MISNKTLIYGVFTLTLFNVIVEEVSSQSSDWQFPFISNFGLSGFPSFKDLPELFNNLSTATPDTTTATSSRKRRDIDNNDDENDSNELQSRLLFIHLPIITSCNHTTQAGSSCLTCRQALRCLPTNVGIVKTCTGLFRYCNNGRCSLFQGSECNETTTTSSSSTSSSTTTTSTSTTSPTSISTSASD